MPKTSIAVSLYCDEIFKERLRDDILGNRIEVWSYIGILIVPREKRNVLLRKLLNRRCLNEEKKVKKWGACNSKCKWHDDNNTEIHYTRLDDTRKFKVACSWIDFLLENGKEDQELVYFYILGLNLSKLDRENFGPASQQNRDITIYNRFFRTAIQKSTKSFFSEFDTIVVQEVYHDKGPGIQHRYFPWHSVYKLQSEDPKLWFECSEITFLNSDHRQDDGHPMHSHFIQFIDLLLGSTFNILHYASKDKNKTGIALMAKPLLGDRIIKKPRNKNSSYNYFGRQRIEFFPKENLSSYDENSIVYRMKRMDNFYTDRELRISRTLQPVLPFTAERESFND